MKWLSYLLLPLGILIGYLIPRDADSHSITQESPPPRKDRSKPRATDAEKSERIRALADGITKKRKGHSDDSDPPEAEIADIPAILERLLSQVGPSGLPWDVRSEINEMLQRWAKEDFEGAYQWARTHPNENARRDFLQAILQAHAETDFDSTLALLKSLQSDDGIILYLGSELFDTAAKRGAREAFEVLAAFPSESGGRGGSGAEFPEGFDFKTFAELSAKYAKDTKGSYPFSHYPTNLLEEWAKIDATAALEFFIANEELPFNDLGSITKTFVNMAEPTSAYPWLHQQYEDLDGDQRARFAGDLHSVFSYEMGAAPLIGLANSIPSPELREQLVFDMIKGFGGVFTGVNRAQPYVDLLSVLPTPEKRLEAIQRSSLRHSMDSVPDQKLSELGITRDQVRLLEQK